MLFIISLISFIAINAAPNSFFASGELNPKEIELVKKPETAAGFWAAKEAASKALGTGIGASCGFHDIKISKSELGAPLIKYKKRVRKAFGIKASHLSISHDSGFVIAVVVNTFK